MAQVILSAVGSHFGGPVGQMIGAAIGAQIDRTAIQSLIPPRQIGPRLEQIRVQGAAEGAPIPAAFGRVRVTGQIIWAARFRENRHEGRAGKGGPRTVDYAYSLSFAVGLCEGPIDGIGRIWADGQPFDASGVTVRVHRGMADQVSDSLIEAVEGDAPAYRDLAYVVFEDLPLEAFGDRVPQLAFEVFRRPRGDDARLEDRLEGVCLIPGSGEFVYATSSVLRREGLFRSAAENVNNREGRADLLVSLDQLQAQLPNLKRVTLVVSWFGDDLRCGSCLVRPKIDRADKMTARQSWSVSGLVREDAEVVSDSGGGPAYGGTPSDAAVIEAVAELKRRGLEVTLAPFLMMDVTAGNGLADPYGGGEQAAYPWRGRISCHPAPGVAGTPDGTAAADSQVAAFFGTAGVEDFGVGGGAVSYGGPAEWSWRRMVLHSAHLAAMTGADGLLIGSELRGLTQVRGATGYPAVEALRTLAQDCRTVMGPDALITYAADWSEWNGVQHADDPGGFVFHLDPLWADPAISCVGIDWYPPVSDWRDGPAHLDALEGWGGASDPAYLRQRIQGGEAFDWFYADLAARDAQDRMPITDGAYGEPWVWRAKDLAGWWSHEHHDRPDGVRAASPTDWTPQMKPIRLIEFGCGAVDKGANAPNLFLDPKSAESAIPPYSNGRRDDLMQRRLVEATLETFADEAANPAASAYPGRMLEAMDAWCWDARPFPDFPARIEVWADGGNWRTGHWLNGRMQGEAADLIAAVATRAGIEPEALAVSDVDGAIEGYLIDRPMTVAAALGPVLLALGLEAAERGGKLAFLRSGDAVALGADDLALSDEGAAQRQTRRVEAPPGVIRLRFIDGAADYATGAVAVRREDGAAGEAIHLDLALVTDEGRAEQVAQSALMRAGADRDSQEVNLAPLAALRLEAGDEVTLPGDMATWRVARVDLDETPRAQLIPVVEMETVDPGERWRTGDPTPSLGAPWLALLDLPGREDDDRLLTAAAGEPWRALDVHAGADAGSLRLCGRIEQPATAGLLVEPLGPGPTGRWDRANAMVVRLEGRTPQSLGEAAVLGGANRIAVRAADGDWEIVQFQLAEQEGPDQWRLSALLRGQGGSEAQAEAGAGIGAEVVVLDEALAPIALNEAERGLPLMVRATPAGGPPGGPASTEAEMTWRGVSRRPWSPAHLKAERTPGGDVVLSWIRRARIGGDGWDLEPPLGEEREIYRVEAVSGGDVAASYETTETGLVWTAAAQTAALGGPAPAGTVLSVAQGSAVWGWGAASAVIL